MSWTHTVDIPAVPGDAKTIREFDWSILTVAEGHSASVFPQPCAGSSIDAVCSSDVDAYVRETFPMQLPPLPQEFDSDRRAAE